jgi:hypothetical protein
MEAENRLSGATLLAALYSTVLSVIAIGRYHRPDWELASWCIASVGAALTLTLSVMQVRERDVSYNYINCLLVLSEIEQTRDSERPGTHSRENTA